MYERHSDRLVTSRVFIRRVLRHAALACALLGVGLGMGILGYHYLCGLEWIDSLVNASMILGGMGPVDQVKNTAGKFFISFYALFSGLAFVAIAGTLVAPFAHRLLHTFHLDKR